MLTRREALVSTAAALFGAVVNKDASRQPASRTSSAGPGTRAGHVLVYDDARGAVCLLGGDRDQQGVAREQPWFWDGATWTAASGSSGPGARTLPTAAYDPARKTVLLFGGIGLASGTRYQDLWELNADGTWTDRSRRGPGPRDHHAAAFDTARGRLVVYGGQDADRRWSTDLWEWDSRQWHRVVTTSGPGERVHHAMAYDSRRRRVVLRGGFGSDRQDRLDTWEWDGQAWHRAAADGPGPKAGYRMAYDAERAVTVLFGEDTCLWDGKTWIRATPPRSPSARYVHAMAYDARRKRVVLYGGSTGRQNAGDTWEWDGTAWDEVRPG